MIDRRQMTRAGCLVAVLLLMAGGRVYGAPGSGLLERVAGSWGGNMNGADIGAGVKLNEMIMDVARDGGSGVWSATVKMNLTIPTSNGLKVVIDVQCLGGRIDGEGIRFDKVPWHRTVIDTGQKDDIEGNPLVLILAPEGGLKGTFEGSDGMSFTLTRRSK